jgi:hypothetical protein
MKRAKEHANELIVAYSDAIMNGNRKIFTDKLSDVLEEVAINELKELQKQRNISLDTGLIPLFKEQRNKYASICKIVNSVDEGLLSISDFDDVIKLIYPDIYEWYVENVLV